MKRFALILTLLTLMPLACKNAPKAPSLNSGDKAEPIIKEDDGKKFEGKEIEASSSFKEIECASEPTVGLRAWRRLSNVEFANTVASVFGVTIDSSTLTSDISHIDVYDTMMVTGNYVDKQRLGAYRTKAKEIAAKVDIAKVFPCLASGATCVTSTLPKLGASAWRRPLEAAEVTNLVKVFTLTSASVGNETAARFVVQALVMAESFLYRSELGRSVNGTYSLTSWEIASALSYAILRRPPDATLTALAQSGALSKTAEIKKQIARLLADPLAKATWKDFASMWLDTKKIQQSERPNNKEFTAALKTAAQQEAGDLFADVMSKASGSNLAAFYTADSVPASDATKTVYDVTPVSGQVKFKDADRRGPLGLASYLIQTAADDHTSPPKRGAFVIERMMCSQFSNFDTIPLPKKSGTQTYHDIYLGLEGGSCGGCHKPMNQIGFMFEGFDMMGRARTEAEGVAIKIDSTPNLDGAEVPVKTVAEFTTALAHSKQGQECFARQIFRYGFGRKELTPQPIISAKPVTIKVQHSVRWKKKKAILKPC
ncbi:MAG: DUF1592 domain-containing protein [Proteobacteria bacterium]|nr:MAG: DUF1592 domain-containing protein [Pseudomonadota bacterium]